MDHGRVALLLTLLVACTPVDVCAEAGEDALATCLQPTQTMEYYAQHSSGYFDTMDTAADRDIVPPYSELVARWEWPPWLKLTAFGYENILGADRLLRLYPSTIPIRDCRGFDTHPFGRCFVTLFYEDEAHEGRGCPIYEEFTFNDAGEITWIEAWSDLPEYLPMADPADRWAEGESVRLSSRVPGLGNGQGLIDLDGDAMAEAMVADRDVLDFVERANDWAATWNAEVEAAGDTLWPRGCGWDRPRAANRRVDPEQGARRSCHSIGCNSETDNSTTHRPARRRSGITFWGTSTGIL